VLLTAACGSSSKPSALQSSLRQRYNIQLSPLPPHATTISKRRAEDIASSTERTTPAGMRLGFRAAGLWRVTDPGLYIPEHGIHRLLVHNQVAWIVLVRGVDISVTPGTPPDPGATGANGPTGETPQLKPVYGTAVVAVNAETGNKIGFWLLPRRLS
jgi:hypothetical protein